MMDGMMRAGGGPIMATEPAFMSVSRSRQASVFYMQDAEHGENVLWQVRPSHPRGLPPHSVEELVTPRGWCLGDPSTDHGKSAPWQLTTTGQTAEGFHMGADVEKLSMYPDEEEVLFPPNTAMIVTRPEEARKVDDDGKRYLVVHAKPSFI